jgi:hypothetical protein
MMMQLVTPWHKNGSAACLLEYDGNLPEPRVSSSLPFLRKMNCPHFVSGNDLGDPWYETLDDSAAEPST